MGEVVVGAGASYRILSVDSEFDIAFAGNDEIETEADTILDFSEVNPFGEF